MWREIIQIFFTSYHLLRLVPAGQSRSCFCIWSGLPLMTGVITSFGLSDWQKACVIKNNVPRRPATWKNEIQVNYTGKKPVSSTKGLKAKITLKLTFSWKIFRFHQDWSTLHTSLANTSNSQIKLSKLCKANSFHSSVYIRTA